MMDIKAIQPKVTSLIQKAFLNQKLTHAYLFSGEPGAGKKDVAFWMAKRFFCINPIHNEPCMKCTECKRIDSTNHPDLHFIEPDGQSIKIEQIRSLQREFHFKGVESDKKCYIIEHVDRMTVQAANSLLKFLEEPNGTSLAILLTENKNRMLDTIISRVQVYNFQQVSSDVLYKNLLKEGLDSDAAYLLSNITKSVTRGKELLEDEWFLNAKDLFINTLEEFARNPFGAVVKIQTEWPDVFSDKKKQQISMDLLAIWFQEVLYSQLGRKVSLIEHAQLIEQFSNRMLINDLVTILEEVVSAKAKLRSNTNYVLVLEQLLQIALKAA